MMKKIYKGYILLVVFYLLAYILPLGIRPLMTPDEFRYAQIPREMVLSGDYVSPTLLGLRYFEKPVLGYQITAVFFNIFGESAFSLRLMSALAAGLSAVLLVIFVRKRSEDREMAALAGGIFLSCGIVYGVGTFAVLDSLFTACLTGTMVCFFFAYVEHRRIWIKLFLLLLCGAFCGAAFLTKGFLAFAIPGIIVVPFLLWERNFKAFITLPWLPLFGAIMTAAPWALLIHQRQPDYWNYFFWIEHIQRFTQRVGGQHPEPWYYFIPILLLGSLPAGVLLVVAIRGFKGGLRDIFKLPRYRYALCYFLFPFLFFSASTGKLGTYILPCFVPWSMLLALGVIRYVRSANAQGFHRAGAVMGVFLMIVGVLISPILLLLPKCFGPQLEIYPLADYPKYIIGSLLIFTWGAVTFATRKASWQRQLAGAMLGALPVLMVGPALMPEQILSGKAQTEPLQKLLGEAKIDPMTIVCSMDNTMHALAWEAKTTNIFLVNYAGELTYGVNNNSIPRLLPMENMAYILNLPKHYRLIFFGRFGKDPMKTELGKLPKPDKLFTAGQIFLAIWEAKL